MSFVRYEKKNKVAIITVNRPERLNAMGFDVAEGIMKAFDTFEHDPMVHTAIITGAGRAFCAGRDLKEMGEKGRVRLPDEAYEKIFHPKLSKPLIGAINGIAYAAGFNLAMVTDIRIASESAMFGMPQIKRGLYGSVTPAATQLIPTCIIMELLCTGEPIDARRAYELGMINTVVPGAQLMKAAINMAEKIAGMPPTPIRLMKETLKKAIEPSEAAFLLQDWYHYKVDQMQDAFEGAKAFAEKRKPGFKNL